MSEMGTGARPAVSPRVQSTLDALLLPLLRANVLARRVNALHDLHPHDAPRGHAAGYDPDKILMVGAGPAYGWGVMSHELALGGAHARATASITGRGCDVDVLTTADLVARQAGELIGDRRLDSYDSILFVLGVQDAVRATSAASWRSAITGLIQHVLSSTTAATTDIFFIGMPPVRSIPIYDTLLGGVAERHGAALNQVTEQLCDAEKHLFYVALPAQDVALGAHGRHRTAAQYNAWAEAISPTIAGQLNAKVTIDGDRRKPIGDSDEPLRQRTVDGLPLVELAADATLKKLVELAHRAFRVETAQFTIIDQQRQFSLVSTDTEPTGIARENSFCSLALQQREPLIVRDARTDERFQNNPLVTGEPYIRFYAGIPIAAPSGETIGTLCVTDSHPRRRRDDINLSYFRELCILVEKELWKIIDQQDSGHN
ncbi:diguanylate cyclase/phosphodiesterase [Leifsonia rubra CMS 76R]|nr:diguanylate cyclase/phosphodiesterase [Leifsonia rubra CMS 76R]